MLGWAISDTDCKQQDCLLQQRPQNPSCQRLSMSKRVRLHTPSHMGCMFVWAIALQGRVLRGMRVNKCSLSE